MKKISIAKACQLLFLALILSSGACKMQEKAQQAEPADVVVVAEPVVVEGVKKYRETPTKDFALIHTRLKVKPDWKKRQLAGEATLTLRPYFYPKDTLVLDAKYFDIKEVALVQEESFEQQPLQYIYDSLQLHIALGKAYRRDDTLCIFIRYTAKPYEGKIGGSSAISRDQGLYFINADGTEAGVPQQIWTQGEMESSSRWFPTIDDPNQKTTEEIYITVDSAFTTLSNGTLQYSSLDSAGMRTDYWKLDKPHAPYLFMMAIGKFVKTKDWWRDSVEVNYYMEPAYASYAQEIFGNTPEMLEFFSDVLHYDFPWPKFAQVVVREFVSGAMENTSAVVFFAKMNRNSRELLDEDYEDIISHELFHHWFGDLVTCESWSNIPLNESFATYGEVLWVEHKYGQDEADLQRYNDLTRYLVEAVYKREKLIRFYYDQKEQMFDRHSYQKGGLILHMLREQVGDEAFFKALNLYLTRRAYNTAEYHDLRMAFEEVTGVDMNPFFNQWFTSAGHPLLNITHHYNDSLQQQELIVVQKQDTSKYPVFMLPVTVGIYQQNAFSYHKIEIKSMVDTFHFPLAAPADALIFDARDAILAQVAEEKPLEQWYNQFFAGQRFKIRLLALQNYVTESEGTVGFSMDSLVALLKGGLSDSFWAIRAEAVRQIRSSSIRRLSQQFRPELLTLALNDPRSKVREEAVIALGKMDDPSVKATILAAFADSSYAVLGAALDAIARVDGNLALAKADSLRNEKNKEVRSGVLRVISTYGSEKEWKWFQARIQETQAEEKLSYLYWLEALLERSSIATIKAALPLYKNALKESNEKEFKVFIANILSKLSRHLQEQKEKLEAGSGEDEIKMAAEKSQKINELDSLILEINILVEKATTHILTNDY